MKRLLITIPVFAALILATFATVNAQGPYGRIDARSVETEIERTQQVIEQAKEKVIVSNSVRARFAFDNAVELQQKAWTSFRRGEQADLRQALMLTKQAREKAKYAYANGMFTEQNEDVVLRQLERVEQMLQRAKDMIGPDANRNLQAIYDSAEDNLKRAWEFYREGRQRPALKLSNQVENTARKLFNAANRRQHRQAGLDRRVENAEESLGRVRSRIAECESETAQSLMEQAELSLKQARQFAGEGQQKAAAQKLQNARRFANQAAKECGGGQNLSTPYEQLVNQADRMAELVPPDNEEAQQLLDQVYQQLELAANLIRDEESEAALAALKAARLSLSQLKRLLGVSGP